MKILDINQLVYQENLTSASNNMDDVKNTDIVALYSVEIDTEALTKLIIKITVENGETLMRRKYDGLHQESIEKKAEISAKIKADPKYKGIDASTFEKIVKEKFAEFQKKHEDELVTHVFISNSAKKESTVPSDARLLLSEGVTDKYEQKEAHSLVLTKRDFAFGTYNEQGIELATEQYQILKYPLLANVLLKLLINPFNLGELDRFIQKHENISGIEYLDDILSIINLTQEFIGSKGELFDLLGENEDPIYLKRMHEEREIKGDSKLVKHVDACARGALTVGAHS